MVPPKLRKIHYPGGIRMPHFHFEGDIYLLDEKQWKEFSRNIIKEFQAKLSTVNIVNFEQLIELSEAIDSLV
jgi:hypothetical protein